MRKYAYIFGVYLQGLILGILLFIALCDLVATASGVRLFRYQGF
jgi:hypothetical protein